MDLVEVVFAYPHRQRLKSKLDKAAALIQRERCVVASSHRELDKLQLGMIVRLGQCRLHQLNPKPC